MLGERALGAGGATAHNTFKIPVEVLTATSQCNLKLSRPLSPAVQVIADAALLLIDEAPMMNKHAYGAIDKSLRDITGVDDTHTHGFHHQQRLGRPHPHDEQQQQPR
jgi:ATP-dependent DNA helicase PIF1